jgi:competence protein ComEC
MRCFEQLGISHIDLLILTHFDKDHVGGLAAVVGKVDYAVVGKPENLEDQMLLKELADSGTRVERGVQGLRGSLGESTWQILWPDHSHPGMEVGNPGSVTSLFSFPSFQAIFLGDLGKDAQEALIHSVIIPDVDVVKVAHHGSADQSQRFYEQLHPEIALFSVGNENDYGHPRTETLEIASRLGALSPRTDEDGLILVGQTSEGLSVWTER